MHQPTILTWVLIIFGLVTCLPLLLAQLVILWNPKGRKAQDILIGKGEEWRDRSHFKTAYGMAAADWLLFFPVLAGGIVGMILAESWGYALFAMAGVISVYINVVLWFAEKEYVFPSKGPLQYYTYYWGNFIYWGLAALFYGAYVVI